MGNTTFDLPCEFGKIVVETEYAERIATTQGIGLMVAKVKDRPCDAIYQTAEGFMNLVAIAESNGAKRRIIVLDAMRLVAFPAFQRSLHKWADNNSYTFMTV